VLQSVEERYQSLEALATKSLACIEAFVSSPVFTPEVFSSFHLSAVVKNKWVLHSVISSAVPVKSSKLSGIAGMLSRSLKSFVLPTTDISASLAFRFIALVITLFSTGFVLVVDNELSIAICLSVLRSNTQVAQS
jgi:hypothetical protein